MMGLIKYVGQASLKLRHLKPMFKSKVYINKPMFRRAYADSPRTNKIWTSNDIRATFLEYFTKRDHIFTPSSSVIPKKDEGTYFINAGMNQFKPIFLGSVDLLNDMANLRRAVNSQKCIRVGGKHNDLEDVGKDSYHHTFFEMLGSWSFGDYFKREACEMAWSLLTEVYHLHPKHLYVSYFAGDEALKLKPDLQTRDIWLQIGVPSDRVLPYGPSDNFWDMGETGPCGPCTEIHYDVLGRENVGHLVNTGSKDVIEIWNLVFMQYDRQVDGSLVSLPRHHVDTGMGLERLIAIMQNANSNYNTDLFLPIFTAMKKVFGCGAYDDVYGGEDRDGVNEAYRVVADHMRMATIAIADGLRPANRDSGQKLRQVMYRCFFRGMTKLGAKPGQYSQLVPVITRILGSAFPDLLAKTEEIKAVVSHVEGQFKKSLVTGRAQMTKACNRYGNVKHLTGRQIRELVEGRFGKSVQLEIILGLAEDMGITLDLAGLDDILQQIRDEQRALVEAERERKVTLTKSHINMLQNRSVVPTDDSHKWHFDNQDGIYKFAPVESHVRCLLREGQMVESAHVGEEVSMVTDRTCFYAEAGGQVADQGTITTPQGGEMQVQQVEKCEGYVVHTGTVTQGSISVADQARLTINPSRRQQCMNNHTATHIINFTLNKLLGNVNQQGSLVSPDKLTFFFTCSKMTLDTTDLSDIADHCQSMVRAGYTVHVEDADLSQISSVSGIRRLQDEVYPGRVQTVSIGQPLASVLHTPGLADKHSVELCGGTHVANTADIGDIVITSATGLTQGTKSITAVSGDKAKQALANADVLNEMLTRLENDVNKGNNLQKWTDQLHVIEKMLCGESLLPKLARDNIRTRLDWLATTSLNEQKNIDKKDQLKEKIFAVLKAQEESPFVVADVGFKNMRDVFKILQDSVISKPVVFISGNKKEALGIVYIPEEFSGLNAGNIKGKKSKVKLVELWARHIATHMGKGSQAMKPKAKFAGKLPTTMTVYLTLDKKHSVQQALDLAQTYMNLYVTSNSKSS